ncbi:MAG: hypothetical protein EBW14_18810, partial [Oxalobacteraceae bacterium]|nr:hypothetical protein [Oxalobacteraceae bacterium]
MSPDQRHFEKKDSRRTRITAWTEPSPPISRTAPPGSSSCRRPRRRPERASSIAASCVLLAQLMTKDQPKLVDQVVAQACQPGRTREQIARIEPRDVEGFNRFLGVSREIFEVAFKGQAEQPFHEIGTLLRAAPDLVRLGGYRSVYKEVCRFFKSDKLRILFSFHPLLIGGNPFTTTAYYCLIAHLERTYGVHYAEGGMGALMRGLVKLVEHNGGEVRCNAEVAEILVKDGAACGVRLANGEEMAADVVVSNADAAFTYSKLLAKHPRRRWTDAKIARARYSMSLFVWYFGTNRR